MKLRRNWEKFNIFLKVKLIKLIEEQRDCNNILHNMDYHLNVITCDSSLKRILCFMQAWFLQPL